MSIHKQLLSRAKSTYPNLHKLIKLNGVIELKPKSAPQLFDYLAKTVVGQQLSVAAARTLWSRVKWLAKEHQAHESGLFYPENEQAIRACGLSRSKFKAICGLTEAISNGSLNPQKILDSNYDEVTKTITGLWGFGEWSADMCAISFCGLEDVYPGKDVSIVNGLQKVCGGDMPSGQIAEDFSPYRSYLCQHIWRGMDNGFIR